MKVRRSVVIGVDIALLMGLRRPEGSTRPSVRRPRGSGALTHLKP